MQAVCRCVCSHCMHVCVWALCQHRAVCWECLHRYAAARVVIQRREPTLINLPTLRHRGGLSGRDTDQEYKDNNTWWEMVSETLASFIKTSLSVSDILQLFRLLISCLSSSVGRSSSASVIHRNLSILSVRRNLPTNSILTLRPFVSFRCCQQRKVCQHPLSSVNGSAASSLGVLFSWCCSELTVEQILMIKPGKYSDVYVVFACSAAWSPTEPRLLLRFFRSARGSS